MRAYRYLPHEAGLESWPSGELRLEGIELTSDPTEADIFICPGNLSMFWNGKGGLDREKIYRLPHFKGNEARTVFLDVSDNFRESLNLPCMFIRCDARSWMMATDPGTINVAWPVDDYADCVEVPDGIFRFDVSFQGWLSSPTRKAAFESVSASKLSGDIVGYHDFTGYLWNTGEGIRRRAEFRRSMRESRVALCPESIPGVFPYRFFEAMSAGRVPVLVGSDFVYPFVDEIPYRDFVWYIKREDARHAGKWIVDALRSTSDRELILKGKLARFYWDKWLNRELWPATMAMAVRQKLSKNAVTQPYEGILLP